MSYEKLRAQHEAMRKAQHDKEYARIIAQRDRLAEASKAFLEMYFEMASSGDYGFWDPGTEKEVCDLQQALAELDKEKQSCG